MLAFDVIIMKKRSENITQTKQDNTTLSLFIHLVVYNIPPCNSPKK